MVAGFILAMAAAVLGLRMAVDADLLERLKAGDRLAIDGFVSRHHGALVGLAQTIVKRRSLAEDVAQETWIAVLTHIDRFDGRSSLSTWIIAILLNKAKTSAKREGRYVGLALEGERDEDGEGGRAHEGRFLADGHWAEAPTSFDGLDPERIVSGRQIWRHVGAFIEELPPAQKAVMILRDVEGKDAAEACRLLELSPENQRVLLHRGRTKVRDRLEALLKR